MTDTVDAPRYVYVVPWEKFVYRTPEGWAFTEPVGKEGITNFLLEAGWSLSQIKEDLSRCNYVRVSGYECAPGEPSVFAGPDGRLRVNSWVRPSLVPKAGPTPRLDRIIDWLVNHDPTGIKWLKHWMAWKVQQPAVVPKVAVVITTTPGAGKGTLATVMAHMLGPQNCDTVKREHLENKFNARWVQKLFVLGDEILSSENARDISASLKVYIDSTNLELEAKFQNQKSVRNRLAWMFASNDPVSSVVVEPNDRRYTVFANHDPIPEDYRQMFLSCFGPDRATPTEDFMSEMAALYHELLGIEVDIDWVSRPYDNAAREALIHVNTPAHELFFRHVEEHGINPMLDAAMQKLDLYQVARTEWDWGEDGVRTDVLYQCYRKFCERSGHHPTKVNKFAQAMRKARPLWTPVKEVTPNGRRNGYKVPRVRH